MKDTLPFSKRLEEIYRILTDAEKRELGRYLSSTYFNRDESLYLLHQFMCKEQPETKRYDKNTAWRAIFKRAAYQEAKFRYMVSDLLAAVEEFIYTEQTLSSKPNFIHILNSYYTLRDAPENKNALASKIIRRNTDKKHIIAPDDYLEQHFRNELIGELHSGSLKTYSKFITENPQDKPTGLDEYYVVEKLRQMCLTANDNNVFGKQSACYNEAGILKQTTLAPFNSNIFIKAYGHVFHMLTDKTEQEYFELKKVIGVNGYEIDDRNLAELFTYARNFCIGKINAGKHEFYEELFELYEQGLKKKVLLPNGEINERNFKNIVTTALRTKKADWASEFINQYRYALNKTVRDNAYNYNIANYFFHTKQFNRALSNLQKVQLSDLFYGLDARTLMIKCYYELDEKEAFLNVYFSFRMFVQRRKNVSEQHRKNYTNFLKVVKKLMNLRPRDKKAVDAIAKEITVSKALADKNWLQEKLKVYIKADQ